MEKIKVKSVSVKKQTDTYTIREVVCEDGRRLDTFDDLKEGQEYSGDVVPNSNDKYNANFKLPKEGKGGKFPPRDYTFDKRRVALECAVQMCCAGKVTADQLTATRDKFYEYLNSK